MKRICVFLWCLLTASYSSFGQTVEIPLPASLVANQAGRVSVGVDGQVYLFVPTGKSGTGTIYPVGGTFVPTTGWIGVPPSPQGPSGLFGTVWNYIVTTLQVADDDNVKVLCSSYTVDGGKGTLISRLPYGPFPSFDGMYLYAGSNVTGTNVSSTLFELRAINATKTTCDLHPLVTTDKEVVQVVKQPGGNFLVGKTALTLVFQSAVTEVGLLDPNGSYTNLIGTSGSQTPARKCCTIAPEWGTARAAAAYTNIDGKNIGVVYNKGVFEEVYNSSKSGQLTVDIWVNDFKGNIVDSPLVLGTPNTLWVTGLGRTDCPGLKAGVAPNAICNALVQPKLLIGGKTTDIYFAGLSPQFPGLYQINFVLPGSVPTGSSDPLKVQGEVVSGDT